MRSRFLAHAIALGALLLIAATARAGDETCYPIDVDWFSPTGIAGCTIDGPTDGIASVYGGGVAAANWCTSPWNDCGMVRVQSHQTGLAITVRVGMYCDCWWMTDRRLVDLTFGQVRALGLNPEAGIFRVTVTPFREAGSVIALLPDTAIRYTSMVGVSDESDTILRGPAAPAYSRTAGSLRTHGSKS